MEKKQCHSKAVVILLTKKKNTHLTAVQPKSSVRSRKKNYFIYFSDFYLLLALLKKKKRAKVEALLSFFFFSFFKKWTNAQTKNTLPPATVDFFQKKTPKTATRLNDVKKKKPYRQFFPRKFRKASKVSLTFF